MFNVSRSQVAVLALLAALLPTSVRAQSSECLGALVRDVRTVSFDSATSFALSDIITRNFSANDRQHFGVTVFMDGIPFSLTSDRARSRAEHFFRQTRVQWGQRTMIAMVSQTLSERAVDAYRACIDGQHRSGPRAIAYDASGDEITVKIVWISPPKAPTTSDAQYELSGVEARDLPKKWTTGEDHSFIFKRKKGQDFRLTANIGGQSDRLFVPYIPRIQEAVSVEVGRYPADVDVRMANDGTGRNKGPISDCFYTKSGEELEPQSTTVGIPTKVGALDQTSYARLTVSDYNKACYEAFLRPLSREGGGDMRFHIKYRLARITYKVVD